MYKVGTIREASYNGERRVEVDITRESSPFDKEIGVIKFTVKEEERELLLGFPTAMIKFINAKNKQREKLL